MDLGHQLWAFLNFVLAVACVVFAVFQLSATGDEWPGWAPPATLACCVAGGVLTGAAWRGAGARAALGSATVVLVLPFVYVVVFVIALGISGGTD
jgi:hypothetical protein